MDQTLLQRVLDGDPEAKAQFGGSEHCAVIDWRDGAPEIVDAVASFLPDGHLVIGRLTERSCELVVQGKPPILAELSSKAAQEQLLFCIGNAIAPEYELRQFRPMDGDSYSIFVAPRSVWAGIDSEHPRAAERLFLSAQRLAAYCSKGFLARMLSRP
ncbi:hypothetical protein QRD43_06410 [Pelomonas sp. APW6]|uniref:Uncharacterized protein n=1 Tax=Roseateles subflavus TaxID=3053353 RepID=A0ABT7LFB4_9BURK|nr:hypothetical protein [Pelomonas sp. APW6]MDL5031537.1 hypothetical protein [Pelomonas sp. APW6]